MKQASFIEEWIEEGREEGLREGREAILARILARRFGKLPTRLPDRLETLTLAQIEELIDQAIVAEDLETVEQQLAAFYAHTS